MKLSRLLLAVTLWSAAARAADPPPAAPAVRLVRLDPLPTSDCYPGEINIGCLAGSRFPPPLEQLETTEALQHEGRYEALAARLWERLLDELVIAWGDKTSPVSVSLGKGLGATALPEPVWQTGPPLPGRSRGVKLHSVPVDPVSWVGVAGSGARFTQVQWKAQDGAMPPVTVILSGRFGERMAASGSPVPEQLLGADARNGEAFYQQMFPVSEEAQRAGFPMRALAEFNTRPDAASPWWDCTKAEALAPPGTPEPLPLPVQIQGGELACFEGLASTHARRLFDQIGQVILRFGLTGTLPAQVRVLAASNSLITPPGRYKALPPVQLDDLVVASQGQLDPASLRETPPPPAGPPGELDIDYSALSDNVINEALSARAAADEAGALDTLNAEITRLFAPDPPPPKPSVRAARIRASRLAARVKDPPQPLTDLSRQGLKAWAAANAAPGQQGAVFQVLPGWALQTLVSAEPAHEQLETERALLLDQLHFEMYSTLSPDKALAPKDQAGSAEKIWAATLAAHNVSVAALPQAGPLMVDPTAVCTLGRGADALGEAVNQQVHLDVYFVDDPNTTRTLEQRLWSWRESLPWIAVDDPAFNRPALSAIDLTLPGGGRVYRARWTVWSGWHLLWRAEAGPSGVLLAPSFGAVCSDLAVVHGRLLPGLVRAALRGDAPSEAKTHPEYGSPDEIYSAALAPLRALAPTGGGVLVALADIQRQDHWRFPIRLLPKDPLARRQARGLRRDGRKWLMAEGRVVLLSDKAAADQVVVAPDRVKLPSPPEPPAEMPAAGKALLDEVQPRYRGAVRAELWTDGELGVVSGLAAAGGTAPNLDLRLGTTAWLPGAPRLALVTGGGLMLLGWPSFDASASPRLTAPSPTAMAFIGLRLAPLPGLERAARRGVAWGAYPSPGDREIRRTQLGLLAAGAAGAGFEDLSTRTLWLEPWLGVSLHPMGVPRQSLQAAHPGLLVGLYGRVGGEPLSTAGSCTQTLTTDWCLWYGGGVRVSSLGERGKKP